jgi:hypothetical protein
LRTERKDEGAAEDFGELGQKQLWAEKERKKRNSFSFSENIFVKKNNLGIGNNSLKPRKIF